MCSRLACCSAGSTKADREERSGNHCQVRCGAAIDTGLSRAGRRCGRRVHGIRGAKSTAALLRRYRHIEEIPARALDWHAGPAAPTALALSERTTSSHCSFANSPRSGPTCPCSTQWINFTGAVQPRPLRRSVDVWAPQSLISGRRPARG
jgi:hypothetical protein